MYKEIYWYLSKKGADSVVPETLKQERKLERNGELVGGKERVSKH